MGNRNLGYMVSSTQNILSGFGHLSQDLSPPVSATLGTFGSDSLSTEWSNSGVLRAPTEWQKKSVALQLLLRGFPAPSPVADSLRIKWKQMMPSTIAFI